MDQTALQTRSPYGADSTKKLLKQWWWTTG